ncbi:ZIP family metal transporter [Gillisia hiemivivida]|uniref:Divalent cation transporter n=1 Tax=Gillisia hiemivivida TaxID=291190 RepID=A0A5C6ZZF0_9FLAO|nr:divalent cation transporter [Gillisia hiemivivida]TXD94783.1 divalent cation transporter [Gillisia hiemivivida]
MIWNIILYAGFSGITVFIGGLLAKSFNHRVKDSPVKDEITHTIIAIGGGIILSAVALVLIPRGMEKLALWELLLSFGLGAILFYYIDKILAKKVGKMATLLAMCMDFIPESIALGAVFAEDYSIAVLLAIFIGLQNLPEAFNSYRDMVVSGFSEKKTLIVFFLLSFSGIVAALAGHLFLSSYPKTTAHLMMFASGGILYLLFQDIAPQSKLKNNYAISLGATLGFAMGMIGEKLI